MKTWEIVALVIGILIIIGILITLGVIVYRKNREQTQPPAPGPSPPSNTIINYKDIIQLVNHYNRIPLSSCGKNPSCSGTTNASLRTDKPNPIVRRWRVYNDSDRGLVGPIRYGDSVVIENIWNINEYPNTNQLLASCGDTPNICGQNVVVGRTNVDPMAQRWTIIGGTNGTPVYVGQTVQFRNSANNQLLSSCGVFEAGGNCGYNVSLRTDADNPPSRLWTIVKVA